MQLENLKTNYLGKEFIYYKEIDSTQDEIWRRIKNNNIKWNNNNGRYSNKRKRNTWENMAHR